MADKDSTPGVSSSGPDADPKLELKKRARRRLVGATALALLAIIVLPMVMDQEPRPVSQDINIRIPSQDPGSNTLASRITTRGAPQPTPLPQEATPAMPQPQPPAAASAATATAVSMPAPTPAPAPTQNATGNSGNSGSPEKTEPKAVAKTIPPGSTPEKPQEKPAEKSSEKHAEKTADKPLEKATEKSAETARAEALLNDQHWIIQLGAYQNPGNVKILQSKIKELGYAVFTEKVDTPAGSRIRVRCGPFSSHEATLKAQARLKKIGAGGPSGGSIAQVK